MGSADSSEFSKRYWFGTDVKSDWKVGSPFALVINGTTTDVGEVLEVDPPRRLSYTFQHILSEEGRKERPTQGRLQSRAARQAREADADP